jgi:hypothetical protein
MHTESSSSLPIGTSISARRRSAPLVLVSLASWLVGALSLSALHREQLPLYVPELQSPARESFASAVWLRPGALPTPSPPSLCTFAESPQGIRLLPGAYTVSATGSLRLDPLLRPRPAESIVLVLGLRLPPCPILALLGSLGGSQGPLLRGLVKLADAQLLRLPSAPSAP